MGGYNIHQLWSGNHTTIRHSLLNGIMEDFVLCRVALTELSNVWAHYPYTIIWVEKDLMETFIYTRKLSTYEYNFKCMMRVCIQFFFWLEFKA